MAGGSGPLLQGTNTPDRFTSRGTSETYHLRGSEVHSDLYYANGSVEALTGYGVINSTLYTKSGSTYKRAAAQKVLCERHRPDNLQARKQIPRYAVLSAAVTYGAQAGRFDESRALLRGTQRANLKLATFTTREVTALGG